VIDYMHYKLKLQPTANRP